MISKNGNGHKKSIIELKDIVKTFPVGDDEITILHGISLNIQQGEFVSIVGPSGNGKSTLLNMVTGIDRPTDGEVIVSGRPIHEMSENQLAKWRGQEVGIIFQFFQMLPSLSLLQNVVLPMEFANKYKRAQRRERAMDLLELVGLADQANKLPSMVSGGQQQRAAIARALATDPALLIADEPTGNLDAKTASQVFDLFVHLIEEQGKTMLMVTHDQELANRIPRKVEIVNGVIAHDSRPQPIETIPAPLMGTSLSIRHQTALRGIFGRTLGTKQLVGLRTRRNRMITLLNKVWFDLWQDKSRTIQVVLVIALGAIAIGLVIGGRNLIADSVLTGSQAAEPPHIRLSVSPPLTKDQLERIERIDGVAEAEGLQTAPVEWRYVGDKDWQTGVLNGREDYTEQKMTVVGLVSGVWPGRDTIGVGQISVGPSTVSEDDTIELRFGERTRTVDVVATMDPVGPTPVFGETFYANGRTFERVTGIDSYSLIQTRDIEFDQERAEATDLLIQEYFEDIGVDSVGLGFPFPVRVQSPDVPPAESILNALFLLLGILGVIVVILGIFLVYNSISAIVSQQVNQIGVMKAIGASSQQVLVSYLLVGDHLRISGSDRLHSYWCGGRFRAAKLFRRLPQFGDLRSASRYDSRLCPGGHLHDCASGGSAFSPAFGRTHHRSRSDQHLWSQRFSQRTRSCGSQSSPRTLYALINHRQYVPQQTSRRNHRGGIGRGWRHFYDGRRRQRCNPIHVWQQAS